jgi:hypothetical protein
MHADAGGREGGEIRGGPQDARAGAAGRGGHVHDGVRAQEQDERAVRAPVWVHARYPRGMYTPSVDAACVYECGGPTTSGAVQANRTNGASATPLGPVWGPLTGDFRCESVDPWATQSGLERGTPAKSSSKFGTESQGYRGRLTRRMVGCCMSAPDAARS